MSSLLIVACWSEQAVRVPGCGSVQLVAKAWPACFLCPAKWTLEQADISVLPPLESYNTVVNWLLRDASPILSLRKLSAVGPGEREDNVSQRGLISLPSQTDRVPLGVCKQVCSQQCGPHRPCRVRVHGATWHQQVAGLCL